MILLCVYISPPASLVSPLPSLAFHRGGTLHPSPGCLPQSLPPVQWCRTRATNELTQPGVPPLPVHTPRIRPIRFIHWNIPGVSQDTGLAENTGVKVYTATWDGGCTGRNVCPGQSEIMRVYTVASTCMHVHVHCIVIINGMYM